MAEIQLAKYRIIVNREYPSGSFSTFIAGHYIETMWDDVANVFNVYHGSYFDDSVPRHQITAGPDLGAEDVDWTELTNIHPIPYSFCDGLNLQTFDAKSLFPYVNKISNPNHFQCTSTVCDLHISDNFTIQPASGTDQQDGAFEVSATSSNGSIKFSLDPAFDFNSEGQASGIFSGYLPGTYTVTAKDEIGCIDHITITIPVVQEYGVKYRAEYKDLNGNPSRVDILERGYTGAIIEVDCGPDPFVLRQEGDGELNKFTPIMPSTGILTLWSPSNFFFRNLFTQDDRKYQMRWYKDYGNTQSAFTPAALDELILWTNLAGPGYNWTAPSDTPHVTFASTDFNPESDYLKTVYAFEEGRTYNFAYEFEALGFQGNGSGWEAATIEIAILDASNSVLTRKLVSMPPYTTGTPVVSGNYEFVAPASAAAIGIKVSLVPAVSDQRYQINSFTNETASEGAGGVGLELKWLGYLISGLYSEPYIKDPYAVTITATDGLADLKNYDFLDKDGNKYRDDLITIEAIAEILAKTDLGINIQTVINRFEAGMNQAVTDDPTAQCKFPPATFYDDGTAKCFDVLSEILKPFGAIIKQRNGKWFIAVPEELVTAANYREFDSTGTLITTGSVNDVVDIDSASMAERAVMEGGSQMLETVPAYGKFFLKHNLLKWASLVKSYGFELDDVYIDGNGIKQFKGWNVNKSNAPGAEHGLKKTKAFEGEYNFYVTGSNGQPLENVLMDLPTIGGIEVVVSSVPFRIEFDSRDLFEFGFDYSVLLRFSPGFPKPLWTRIQWTLKLGIYYFSEQSGWITDSSKAKNNIYIERFNDKQSFKITGAFRSDVGSPSTETAVITFYLQGINYSDFSSLANLKSIATVDNPVGQKLRGHNGVDTYRHYYVLENSTDDESSPDTLRPIDYATSTNEKVWRFQDYNVSELPVDYIYLDNVVLLHFPGGAEPPDDVTVERDNNSGIKINFEEEYLLNDIDTENINNSEQTYKNYFKLLNGTPTQTWERTYRAGQGKLLDLLSNDILSQYKTPSNKITGMFLIDQEVLPSTILNEVNDGNRKYMFMGYELHDKHANINFDILELKDTVTDDESEDIDAGFSTGFSLGFRS